MCVLFSFISVFLATRQVRELLSAHQFPGDDIPVLKGSALCALEGREDDTLGKAAVQELMQAVDDFIPTPARDLEKVSEREQKQANFACMHGRDAQPQPSRSPRPSVILHCKSEERWALLLVMIVQCVSCLG